MRHKLWLGACHHSQKVKWEKVSLWMENQCSEELEWSFLRRTKPYFALPPSLLSPIRYPLGNKSSWMRQNTQNQLYKFQRAFTTNPLRWVGLKLRLVVLKRNWSEALIGNNIALFVRTTTHLSASDQSQENWANFHTYIVVYTDI